MVVFPHSIAEGHGDGFGPEPSAAPAAVPASSAPAAAPASSATEPVGSAAAQSEPPPQPTTSASAAAVTKPQAAGGPPDPEPLRLADQWEYELEYDGGKIVVAATRPHHFDKPQVSARRVGRFAIELWIGPELVDRIRFDFPGLGLEAPPDEPGPKRPLYPPASFSKGVHARQTVWVPATPRARRAVLLDRATGESQPLPWPPDHPLNDPAAPPR